MLGPSRTQHGAARVLGGCWEMLGEYWDDAWKMLGVYWEDTGRCWEDSGMMLGRYLGAARKMYR